MLPVLYRFAIVFLSIASCSSVHAQSALHTEDRIIPATRLSDLDTQGNWVFDAGGQQLTVPNTTVVRFGAWSGSLQKSAVWLTDGSWLAGRLEFISADEIKVHSEWFQPLKVNLREVRGIVLVAPASINAWNRLQFQLNAVAGSRDTLWLRGNRQISGVLRISVDEFDQMPRYVLDNAGQVLNVEAADVLAMAFSPTLLGAIPDQATQSVLAMNDGSRLNVRNVIAEPKNVRIELASGAVLQSLDARSEFCVGITSISNQPDRTKFLAELEVASYKHVSQSQLNWPLGKNRDLLGRPLMIANEDSPQGIVDRGLATHSSSQVAFRIDGSKQKFLAEVNLASPPDGADQRLGSAVCQVLVARGGKLQTVESFTLDRTANRTKLLEIDLDTAQLLVLVTEQGDFAQYGDHVLWLDARIAQTN